MDTTRIYLVGSSGGGYTALLVLGQHPEQWAGVSAWVPITDLAAWYSQTAAAGRKYAQDIMNACGGQPGESPVIDQEYRTRSPMTYLSPAIKTPVDINAGIHDGHSGSVPVSHSLHAFNALSHQQDQISEEHIENIVTQRAVPDSLNAAVYDSVYGLKQPLFRRSSDNVRITLFEGGHEIIPYAALTWLSRQRKVK